MESNLNSSKYIKMSDYSRSWYFYDDDIRVPDEDITKIQPLSIYFSELLWEEYISNRNCHFSLLDSQDKLSLLEKQDYNWLDDWNNGTYDNFTKYLNRSLPFNQEDTIIVFWSKESAVETNWSIFIKHWANFFFDDEGIVLINTSNENVLVFCSDGNLLKGKRISEF